VLKPKKIGMVSQPAQIAEGSSLAVILNERASAERTGKTGLFCSVFSF
jgi:hypothetical protein